MPLRAVPGAGLDPDLCGHHEGGIEADPELADQADILLAASARPLRKALEPEWAMVPRLASSSALAHADAGIGDGQGVFLCHRRSMVISRGIWASKDFACRQALVPEFFQGIGAVGDQVPAERYHARYRASG